MLDMRVRIARPDAADAQRSTQAARDAEAVAEAEGERGHHARKEARMTKPKPVPMKPWRGWCGIKGNRNVTAAYRLRQTVGQVCQCERVVRVEVREVPRRRGTR